MNKPKQLSLAYSSCPNDTFIFHGLAHGEISLGDLNFDITLADVETLNQKAQQACFDITKLSFAAFGNLRESYGLLRTGAALGKGCGPLIVAAPGRQFSDNSTPVIAVPGLGTTACLLLRFFLEEQYPDINPTLVPMPFDRVMPAITASKTDFGVIIHEGRFVFESLGLDCLADLGEWWEKSTSLPIPLGCIAVKRSIDSAVAQQIEQLIGKSIDYAWANPEKSTGYIKEHAQEMADPVINEHIRLYVNNFSRDIGPDGESAITTFFNRAEAAGLIPCSHSEIFASP